jgi:hypothetical protein
MLSWHHIFNLLWRPVNGLAAELNTSMSQVALSQVTKMVAGVGVFIVTAVKMDLITRDHKH